MKLLINFIVGLLVVLFIDQSCVVSYVDHRPRYESAREYVVPAPKIVGKKVSSNGDSLYIIRSVTVDEMITYRKFYRKANSRYEP
jgi:hypothetical protein